MDLAAINAGLKAKGVRLVVVQMRQGLFLRGTLPRPDSTKAQQRVSLGLAAVPANLIEAELRALQLHSVLANGTYLSAGLPWAVAAETSKPLDLTPQSITCAEAIEKLDAQFWAGRTRSSAAERTWDRIASELRRLPAQATLTVELLVAVAATTEAGSRSRLEACKTFARLLKAVGLDGADELSRLKGTYTPKPRELPEDEQLLQFLLAIRPTKWGWATCAAATYWVRPAEVPSLVMHDDGTASCLSLKVKGRKPVQRTCFALPKAWIEMLNLAQVDIPSGARWIEPDAYDSAIAQRWV